MHYNAYRILHAISLPVKMSPVLCLNFGSASTVHAVRCLNSYCAQTLTTCRYSKKEVPLSKIGSFGTTGDSVAPLLKRVERCFCSFYKPKPNLQISDYHLPISIKEILEGKNIFFDENKRRSLAGIITNQAHQVLRFFKPIFKSLSLRNFAYEFAQHKEVLGDQLKPSKERIKNVTTSNQQRRC